MRTDGGAEGGRSHGGVSKLTNSSGARRAGDPGGAKETKRPDNTVGPGSQDGTRVPDY